MNWSFTHGTISLKIGPSTKSPLQIHLLPKGMKLSMSLSCFPYSPFVSTCCTRGVLRSSLQWALIFLINVYASYSIRDGPNVCSDSVKHFVLHRMHVHLSMHRAKETFIYYPLSAVFYLLTFFYWTIWTIFPRTSLVKGECTRYS